MGLPSMAKDEFQPVGKCIYCGASRYSVARRVLGDEHIVPEGLGGDSVLPRSSCFKCEQIINRFETVCQKQMLEIFRYQFGITGKKRKTPRKTTEPFELIIDNKEYIKEIEISRYPVRLILPWMPPPRILEMPQGGESNVHRYSVVHCYEDDELDNIRQEFGAQAVRFRSGTFNVLPFGRMLAKVGHSAAAAVIGVDYFRPMLLPVIFGDSSFRSDYLVGSTSAYYTRESSHLVRVEWIKVDGRDLLAVFIRLFPKIPLPEYVVIAGVRPGMPVDDLVPKWDGKGKLWTISNECVRQADANPERSGTLYVNVAHDDALGGINRMYAASGDKEIIDNWRLRSMDRGSSEEQGDPNWDKRLLHA